MSYKVSEKVDAPNIFLAKFSEMSGRRFDPEMLLFTRKVHRFQYPVHKVKNFFREPPQYGAGERGIERTSDEETRYVRITDIDENGILSSELGATAEKIEDRYLIEDGDLLLARSGNTVGKSYLHQSANVPYPCIFAGYLIRLRFKSDEFLPEYAFALTQMPYYKEWVKAVQRVAGQPNINAEEYSHFEVPTPSLAVQQKIVSLLDAAQLKKQQRETQAREMLDSIDDVLLAELGINLPSKPDATLETRVFTLSFRKLTGKRLDCFRYQEYQQQLRASVKASSGPSRRLRECVTEFIGGDWGSDDAETYDTEKLQRCLVVRNTEFDNDYNLNFASGREKYRLIKKSKLDSLDVQPYDLLIEKSGGSPDQPVGRAALLEPHHFENGQLCFSNFLSKIRIDSTAVDPAFLFLWLQASHRIGITQSMQSQTNGIRNLIFDEYLDQDIPVPSMAEQISIRDRILKLQEETKNLFQNANEELNQAKREIEAMILGEATNG